MGQNTSITGIANAALIKLGDELLISIDDGSKRAESIKTIFQGQYEQVLRIHPWNFATKRILLPADVEVPAYDWMRQFTLPTDFVRLIEVRDGRTPPFNVPYVTGDEILYEFEGRKILSNLPAPLKISYIYNAPITLMTADFEDLLACAIAYELAETVSRSNPKKATLSEEFKTSLAQCKKTDTLEGPARPMPDTGWVFANLGYSGGGSGGGGTFTNTVL
jgi:hypothetical protein